MTDRSFAGCRVTDNGFVQLIEALKVNTTLIKIDLSSTFLKFCHVFRYLSFKYFIFSLTIFTINVFYLENNLGDDGLKFIADVMKVNKTLKSISIRCESFFLFFCLVFRLLLLLLLILLLLANNIGDDGASYIAEALTVNNTINQWKN